MRIGTVVSAASLSPRPRLADGVSPALPGGRLTALCLTPTEPDEPFDVVRLGELGLSEPVSPQLDAWPPLGALLRPAFLRYLLQQAGAPSTSSPRWTSSRRCRPWLPPWTSTRWWRFPRVAGDLADDDLRPR